MRKIKILAIHPVPFDLVKISYVYHILCRIGKMLGGGGINQGYVEKLPPCRCICIDDTPLTSGYIFLPRA